MDAFEWLRNGRRNWMGAARELRSGQRRAEEEEGKGREIGRGEERIDSADWPKEVVVEEKREKGGDEGKALQS